MTQVRNDKQPDEAPRRRARPASVGQDMSYAARAAFDRSGFADPTLVLRWMEIAGRDTARLAIPIRLREGPTGGTLTLMTEPAAALFLQHESRSLCERINTYLGRPVVTRLRFVQGSLTPPRSPAKLPVAAEPPTADPVRSWRGPEPLGNALVNLARRRAAARTAD